MAKTYNINIDNIDGELLDEQRKTLRDKINLEEDPEVVKHLEGIEALLDAISDKIYHGDCTINITYNEEPIKSSGGVPPNFRSSGG